MSVLFFSTVHDRAAQDFQAIVLAGVGPDQLELCGSVKALSQRLHRPRSGLTMVVIKIASQEELRKVVSLKDLLDDLPTILILPEVSREGIARAHEMRPRFLAGSDCSPIVMEAVLAKMLRKQENRAIPKGRRKNERRN